MRSLQSWYSGITHCLRALDAERQGPIFCAYVVCLIYFNWKLITLKFYGGFCHTLFFVVVWLVKKEK